MTLAELIDRYIRAKAAQGRYVAKSVHAVENRLATLARSFGAHRPAVELHRNDIEAWLGTLTHLKATSRSSYLSSVKTFTRWAAGRELLPSDPCTAVEGIRRPKSVPRALPPGQVAAILTACRNPRERAMIWLMVGCGLRSGEVAGLDWSDVSLAEQLMVVTGKNDDEREVPIPAEVLAALLELPHRSGSVIDAASGCVQRAPGTRVKATAVASNVGKIIRAAGVKQRAYDGRSAHALRHTCASDVLDQCHDLRTVQQMLGHQNLATTAIYLRRTELEEMRTAMEGRRYMTG